MKILKSREEYKKLSKKFNDCPNCRLCTIKKQYTIKKFKNWKWVFSEFPYYKYHTILIPKSHVKRFHELKKEELLELPLLIKEVESLYKCKNIIGKKSIYGKQLLIFWRSRYWAPQKKCVEHLHIHICPEFENAWDTILDKKAHEIDTSVLLI